MGESFDRDDHYSGSGFAAAVGGAHPVMSDLTFIEMEARMHYHNRRNWDMDWEFHYWARNV
jgi:hypothetical protein